MVLVGCIVYLLFILLFLFICCLFVVIKLLIVSYCFITVQSYVFLILFLFQGVLFISCFSALVLFWFIFILFGFCFALIFLYFVYIVSLCSPVFDFLFVWLPCRRGCCIGFLKKTADLLQRFNVFGLSDM